MDEIVGRREKNLARVQDLLGTLATSRAVKRLPLTPELMLAGYKRALAGRAPFRIKKSPTLLDADSMISETVAHYLAAHPGHQLLFCSAMTGTVTRNTDLSSRCILAGETTRLRAGT